MRAAAQAEISSPSESPSVLPLAAVPCLAENSRLGFEPKEINSQQGWSEINFKTAPGMRVSLRRNGIRSRCQSLNRYAYVMNNPTSSTDPLGLGDAGEACGSFAAQFDWFDCHFSGGGGGGGVGRGPSTNPFDRSSYTSTNDASCASPPGLWSNGQPIYGTSGGSVPNINGLGGGGGPLSGDYGPFAMPSPVYGPGCDFGTCVPGVDVANSFTPDVNPTPSGYPTQFRISIFVDEFLDLPLGRQVFQQAGRNAAPVASPLMPVAWYGGSTGLALIPAYPAGYQWLQELAGTNPRVTIWIMQIIQGYITKGAVPGPGAAIGRAAGSAIGCVKQITAGKSCLP